MTSPSLCIFVVIDRNSTVDISSDDNECRCYAITVIISFKYKNHGRMRRWRQQETSLGQIATRVGLESR